MENILWIFLEQKGHTTYASVSSKPKNLPELLGHPAYGWSTWAGRKGHCHLRVGWVSIRHSSPRQFGLLLQYTFTPLFAGDLESSHLK